MSNDLRYLRGEGADVNIDWQPWLQQVAVIYNRLLDRGELPFHGNEQASVSVLLGAAYLAGYIGMAEYGVERHSGKYGSSDLWIEANQTDYWFEFKTANAKGKYDLRWAMGAADTAFGSSLFEQGYLGYASVIAATDDMTDEKRDIYEAFANEVDLAVHLGPNGKRGAYLYFKLVRQA